MFLAYLDLVGGLAGDMFVAALADAGVPEEEFQNLAQKLPGRLKVSFSEKKVHGLRAKTVSVRAQTPGKLPNTFSPLMDLVSRLDLPREIISQVQELLRLLFEAEAKVHGLPLGEVHLHELSAYDTLFDFFAVVHGLRYLKVHQLYASPAPLSRGGGPGSHGFVPYPAPATLEILKGLPVTGFPEEGETITPTGAALLKGLKVVFGPLPNFSLLEVGVGAGQRDWISRPNIVRFLWGKALHSAWSEEEILEIYTDLDDETPEFLAGLAERLREAGALDVSLWPVYMKKGRLGTRLQVLSRPEVKDEILAIIFDHSSTLGIRLQKLQRVVRERRLEVVETPWGKVRVKVSERPSFLFKVEWEDLKRISQEQDLSLNEVRQLIYGFLFKRYPRYGGDKPE